MLRYLAVLTLLVAVAAQGPAEQLVWTLGQNYEPMTLAQGDSTVFNWTGQGLHGLWELPTTDCPSSPSDPHTVLVDPVDGRDFTFTCSPSTTGEKWFGCPVDGHCSLGMHIQITCNTS